MSEWFSTLSGDTATFALRVSFQSDPIPARGMAADVTWSWGSVELWVAGRCLTRAHQADGTYSNGVQWYLLPLLEWMAKHLLDVVNEEAFPAAAARDEIPDAAAWLDASGEEPVITRTNAEEDAWFGQRSAWRSRHAWRSQVLDAAFPMVLLRRLGVFVEVSWDNESWSPPRPDLDFTERRGSRLVSPQDVARVVLGVVGPAAQALSAKVPSPRVHALVGIAVSQPQRAPWQRLLHHETAEALSSRTQWVKRIEAAQPVGLVARHTLETWALRSVRTSDPGQVGAILDQLTPGPGQHEEWPWNEALLPDAAHPWLAGYDAALRLRERLAMGSDPIPDVAPLLTQQGITSRSADLGPGVRLMVTRIQGRPPSVIATPTAKSLLRSNMAWATGLGHLLLDIEPVTVAASLEYWPSAARARAFAAMLLMPETGLRAVLRDADVDVEGVRAVMKRFGTSPTSTTWHLKNLGFIGQQRREELLEALVQ